MKALLASFATLAFLALSGCGEDQQVVTYKQGKYQGKPDGQPWNSEPVAFNGSMWTKGDRASWEAQVNRRTLTQNEDRRIYH